MVMEFHAYPSPVAGRKDQNLLLRVQSALHSSDSIALPSSLLLIGTILVVYQHMTDDNTGRHSVRNFLAKILASMTPLALLERKILSCVDPIALFAKLSAKVLLMHTCFLGLRMACLLFPDVNVGYSACNVVAFTTACVMLPWIFGLRAAFASVIEHRDVWGLALVCAVIALLEVMLLGRFGFSSYWTRLKFIEDVLITGSDYIEILAFVPAVWMAWRKEGADARVELADSQKRAICLFAFLVAFYCVEDVFNAMQVRKAYPLAACGHFAHFSLLMDFSAFVLAHLYDPEKFAKLRGSIAAWVADACAV
eukprot:CAMPEP_0171058400 /NCGR_PEP_ID=MMETSP0766_2-20121228/2475_1 /TAXON_ID=439317 /ORGANISM="Gambierdiscus australes, Strain CAWD 149" /LENGTH=308 /DNA_ID=CAMNT_0011513675 /DNA_START=83 /DNA_END=1009 /DNA_ORIENTATION=+